MGGQRDGVLLFGARLLFTFDVHIYIFYGR